MVSEFNDKAIDGLFAATPPLEALRLLLRWAATVEGKGIGSFAGAWGRGKRKGILIADVARVVFEASGRRDVCAELPEEALEEGESAGDVVGKLMASLYGARDASAKRQEEVNKSLKQWGFKMRRYNPCAYFHKRTGCTMPFAWG